MGDLGSSVSAKWSASDPLACEVCESKGLCKSALTLCRPCLSTHCPHLQFPERYRGYDDYSNKVCGMCGSSLSYNSKFERVWVYFCIPCVRKNELKKTAAISYLQHLNPSPLSEDFKGDVSLIVDGIEIQSHRYIIGSRSLVFKTMMEADMKEKHTGKIYIKGISAAAVRAAINFMYNGTIKFNKEVKPHEVLKFAHRYEMSWLKDISEKALVETISCENIVELLSISYTLDAVMLKKKVMEFFSKQSASEHCSIIDGIFDKLVQKTDDM